MRGLRDFLPVHVEERNGHRLPGEHLVVVFPAVGAEADAFVLDRLPRTVERAVGEKDCLRFHVALRLARAEGERVPRDELLALEARLHHHARIPLSRFGKLPEGIRPRRHPARGKSIVALGPQPHLRALDGFARAGIEHEAPDVGIVLAGAQHEREVAHPDLRVGHDIVLFAEVRLRAGDERVIARHQILRHREFLHALAEVRRRGQRDFPRALRLHAGQALLQIVVPLRAAQFLRPVEPDEAEMQCGQIAVAHGDGRPRHIPHALGLDAERLRFDLLQEITAELPAEALRKCLRALLRDGVRFRRFFLRELRGPIEPRPRRQLVIRPLLREAFQRRDVASIFFLAGRAVLAEAQPLEVAVQQRGFVRVIRVRAQEILEKADRLHRDRIARRLPLEEILSRPEYRPLRRQLEFILRLRARLLAGGVKCQRLVREEVVERRAIRIRHRALLQQRTEVRDRDLFQLRLRRERPGKMRVDLREQPRQIPRREILPRRLRRPRALQKLRAVLLKILPIPLRENRLHHRPHFRRRLCHLRLQPRDPLLRLSALDLPLVADARRHRLDRLGPRLILQRPLDDRREFFDRRLRQPLLRRVRDLLPQGIARAGRGEGGRNEQKLHDNRQADLDFHRESVGLFLRPHCGSRPRPRKPRFIAN